MEITPLVDDLTSTRRPAATRSGVVLFNTVPHRPVRASAQACSLRKRRVVRSAPPLHPGRQGSGTDQELPRGDEVLHRLCRRPHQPERLCCGQSG